MHYRRFLIGAFALASFGLISLAMAPAHAESLDDIMSAKKLRIAVSQDFPPFGSIGPDMQPLGLDVDLGNLIAQKLGVEAEFTPVTSSNRIPYLVTNKVDIIIAGLGKNAEREKVIDFTLPYAAIFNGVFGTADSGVSKVADLSGKTVAVALGNIEDLDLTKIAPSDAKIQRFDGNTPTLAAYLSGQTQFICATSNLIAVSNSKTGQKQAATLFKMRVSPAFIGVNKEQPKLLDKLNEILSASKADGKLNDLSKKWLGEPLPDDL